jgi:hypothetical protein
LCHSISSTPSAACETDFPCYILFPCFFFHASFSMSDNHSHVSHVYQFPCFFSHFKLFM